MKTKNNIGMIEVVAKGLGPLKERAVFVGGATGAGRFSPPLVPVRKVF